MIFEAIAIIQTANTAIGAVKEMINNGGDLMSCGKQLGTYFDAKAKIQVNANSSGSGSDLELFFALEKLKQQEAELKQLLIYSGRAGMWQEWLQFQSSQKQKRDNDKKELAIKKTNRIKKITDWSVGIAVTLAVLSAVGICAYILYWIITTKGK
tara:strand:- start:468 stop:929 length:462 start_codon:yes stop_codon:yes gene_type:complete